MSDAEGELLDMRCAELDARLATSTLAGLLIAPVDPRPTALVFDGMFTIRPGGHVDLEPGVDLDDAARAFWAAVERMCPDGLRDPGTASR